MVHQNYQNLIEMTSNIIYIVAFGVGFKCPHKIHLNTQWGWVSKVVRAGRFAVRNGKKFSVKIVVWEIGDL